LPFPTSVVKTNAHKRMVRLAMAVTSLLPDRWHNAHPKCHLEINRKTRLVGEAA